MVRRPRHHDTVTLRANTCTSSIIGDGTPARYQISGKRYVTRFGDRHTVRRYSYFANRNGAVGVPCVHLLTFQCRRSPCSSIANVASLDVYNGDCYTIVRWPLVFRPIGVYNNRANGRPIAVTRSRYTHGVDKLLNEIRQLPGIEFRGRTKRCPFGLLYEDPSFRYTSLYFNSTRYAAALLLQRFRWYFRYFIVLRGVSSVR